MMPVGVARCTAADLVVSTLIGHEDVAVDRESARVIERAGGDAEVILALTIPEERRAARAAESAPRLRRGVVPAKRVAAAQLEITAPR